MIKCFNRELQCPAVLTKNEVFSLVETKKKDKGEKSIKSIKM